MAKIESKVLDCIRREYVDKCGRYYGAYIDDKNAKFFDGVVEYLERISDAYGYQLYCRPVTRKKCFDKELLYTDIDTAIEYLKKIKSEGYTSIDEEWDSYESYGVYAYKDGVETVEEAAHRIFKNYIYPKVRDMAKRDKEIREKEDEIKRISEEIDRLKKGEHINDY